MNPYRTTRTDRSVCRRFCKACRKRAVRWAAIGTSSFRWGGGDVDSYASMQRRCSSLDRMSRTSGGTTTRAMQHVSRTAPIVFVNVTDPVGGA